MVDTWDLGHKLSSKSVTFEFYVNDDNNIVPINTLDFF